MSHHARCVVLCIVVCLAASSRAFAPISVANQRLDSMLHLPPWRSDKVVLAGRITRTWREQDTRADQRIGYPLGCFVEFHVVTAILGDKSLEGRDIRTKPTPFDWPRDLVPWQVDTFCILVVRPADERGEFSLGTVVPARRREYPRAENVQQARHIVAAELLAQLDGEKSVRTQEKLVLLAAPILPPEDAEPLVPLLESKDPGLRRAALAALVYARREPRYIQLAEDDLRQVLKTTNAGDLVEVEHGVARDAFSLLFGHYFFLDDASMEFDPQASSFLPLFRVVAGEERLNEGTRWSHGIRPLLMIGTKEDLKRLWDYYQGERVEPRKQILENPGNRQRLLLGMSRILGNNRPDELPFEDEKQFLDHEPALREKVRLQLIEAGILKEAPATPR